MKKDHKLDSNLSEDLEFARKTEEAWKRIEEGKGIKMGFDDFLNNIKRSTHRKRE